MCSWGGKHEDGHAERALSQRCGGLRRRTRAIGPRVRSGPRAAQRSTARNSSRPLAEHRLIRRALFRANMGYRVAHNAAATYIARQRRKKLHKLATLEDFAA